MPTQTTTTLEREEIPMAKASTPETLDSRADAFTKFIDTQQKVEPGSVFRLDDAGIADVEVIPTGIVDLDIALGVGGLPRGRIVELFGPHQSGKSSLSMQVCAMAQSLGGFVGYVDAEHAFNPAWAVKAFGIKEDRLALAQPDDGNHAFQMVQRMAESNAIDVIVVDSLAALVPPAQAEAEIGEANQLGQHAKMISDALRRLTPIIANSRAVLILVNQVRLNPGAYGNPETTTGGKAPGFYSSVRIEVRSSASKRITVGSEVVGQICTVKIPKNKVAPPYRAAEYELYYETGIALEASLVSAAEKLGVVTRAGASYTEAATGERIAVGKEATKTRIAEDDELYERLVRATYAAVGVEAPAALLEARLAAKATTSDPAGEAEVGTGDDAPAEPSEAAVA